MDTEISGIIKRLEREIGLLHREDRLLRERIASSSGDQGSAFYTQVALNGTLSAEDGIEGGGTFPGTVTVAIDLADWSGLEFTSGELLVDEDEDFSWLGEHMFKQARGELQASHFSMGESHGLGGTNHIASVASLKEDFEVP